MPSADSSNPTRRWTRLDAIDALRGLAIFFVLMNHVNMRLRIARIPYAEGLPHQLVSSLVWSGQYGVQIFFAISGFLITSTAIRRWGALPNVNPRAFYLLRFARIAPLLLLLLAALTALHLAQMPNYVVPAKTGGLPQALFAALTFHINVLEAQRGYLPANWDILWSLSVEEVFYLFFPLACRFLPRGKLLISLLVLFVAMGPFARTLLTHGNEVWKEYSYLGSMDAIALGCLTALFVSRRHLPLRILRSAAVLGSALILFILCFSVKAASMGLDRTGLDMSILAIGVCLLMTAAAQTNWKAPRFLTPLLRLGERSYEVYLTHMFIVFAFFDWFLAAGKPKHLILELFVSVILTSALLGTLVARFYSEPLNRALRHRFGDGPTTLASVLQPAKEASQLIDR